MLTNTLATATSPYLLQHRGNPVAWQQWTPETLRLAKKLDRPILLSIGYAACHWCHVMAHESFEDAATAAIMNSLFVNIKVDREERPDLDRTYMTALHAMGEQGGWPLTMFLTPEAEPFWGGTYFPPEARYGRPSFRRVLTQIASLWQDDRTRINDAAGQLTGLLASSNSQASPGEPPAASAIRAAATAILSAIDPIHGGLKGAPKFPQAPIFAFLHQAAVRNIVPEGAPAVTITLDRMTRGGIYDQLGGGLARYSTDGVWLVPHFEKMLYDNAQLVALLTRATLAKPNPNFDRRITETIGFLFRELQLPDGCFAASLDADQAGEEGKYYTWQFDEIRPLLGEGPAARICAAYDVTPAGNWEATNILNLSNATDPLVVLDDPVLAAARQRLLEHRQHREPPGRDDKILTDWNAITITALAEASFVLDRPEWLAQSIRCAEALLARAWTGDTLFHSWRGGHAGALATADDYAHLMAATLRLHAFTGEHRWLAAATNLHDAMAIHHWDNRSAAYLFASDSADSPITRHRFIADDVTANANAVMIEVLTHLQALTGEPRYGEQAFAIARSFASDVEANPFAAPTYYRSCLTLADPIEIRLVNRPQRALLLTLLRATGLDTVIVPIHEPARLSADHPARLQPGDIARPAVLVCRTNTCSLPAHNAEEVMSTLALLRIPTGSP